MASVLFAFFLLSFLPLLHSTEEEMRNRKECPTVSCGNLSRIPFPFTNRSHPECGVFRVDCLDSKLYVQFSDGARLYLLENISWENNLRIFDEGLSERLEFRRCESLSNLSFPNSSFFSFDLVPNQNQTFFKCNRTLKVSRPPEFKAMPCGDSVIYYNPSNKSSPSAFPGCSIIQLPKNFGQDKRRLPKHDDPFSLVNPEFDLQLHVSPECYQCYDEGGQCKVHAGGKFYCDTADKGIDMGITNIPTYIDS